MKQNVSIITFLFFITSLLVTGCSDDKDEVIEPNLSISPQVGSIEFSFDGTKAYAGEQEINPIFTVSTNQSLWEVAVTPAEAEQWCKVKNNSDNTGFTISAIANINEEKPTPTIVTVSAGDAKPIVINVTQAAKPGPVLEITPHIENIFFSFDGLMAYSEDEEIEPIFAVSINQSGWDFVVTPDEAKDWCKVEKNSDNTGFIISAIANNSPEAPITATIRITAGEAKPVEIEVIQEARPIFKVGDYWPDASAVYENGTLISGKAAQGIVFWLDTEDPYYNNVDASGTKGKIISLDESEQKWFISTMVDRLECFDNDNGLANMAIASQRNWNDLPAFEWVHNKNSETTVYAEDATNIWYLPAINELMAFYQVWNGPGEPESSESLKMREAFNEKFTMTGGTDINKKYYWTSTEATGYYKNAIGLSFWGQYQGVHISAGVEGLNGVRAILAF